MRQEDRQLVRSRAQERCEYCRLHELDSPVITHQIEHVIPKKHGGGDDLENLALACVACNLYKGPNISGLDPETGSLTRLFHPRSDKWDQHFAFDDLEIDGLTAIGRTTIAVLRLNDQVHLRLRIAAES
jgi:5-methylcytosine-specific restriction endonuclease McrA